MTLIDQPNDELSTARQLASAAGASHETLQRSPDYYGENAERAVQLSGGMWSILDGHFTGIAERLASPGFGTVLTGCYADYLLKGLSFNRRHRLLFNKALPIYEFTGFSPAYYHDHVSLREPWQRQVDERLLERYPPALREDYPNTALAIESLRTIPMSREADATGRLVLWAATPWAPIFGDRRFLEVYERIPARAKLNGVLFGRAVTKVVDPRARHIPNNNYGTPVDASERGRVATFLLAVARRKLRRLAGLEPSRSAYESGSVTTGSWPNWRVYLSKSPEIARLWSTPSAAERALFTDILGKDPWLDTAAQWSKRNPLLFARILTARIWLRQRGGV